jgi:hypothetical protein
MEKHTYLPAGKTTVPPPTEAAASIAAFIAGVSMVLPFPLAPNERIQEQLVPRSLSHIYRCRFVCSAYRSTGDAQACHLKKFSTQLIHLHRLGP